MKKKRRVGAMGGKQAHEALIKLHNQKEHPPTTDGEIQSRPTKGKLTKTAARRRRSRQKTVMTILAVILIIVGLIASFVLIFRFKEVQIEGDSIYSDTELKKMIPLEVDDNIFGFDTAEAEAKILQEFIYIEQVEVRRALPSDVVIKVEPAIEKYMIEVDTERYVLSKTLKTLRTAEDGEAFTGIVGLEPSTPSIGFYVTSQDENRQNMLNLIISEMQKAGIDEQVTEINIIDTLNMVIVYDGRIDIQLGSDLSMEYKMQMVAKVLSESIQQSESGSIDASVPGTAVFKSS